MNVLCMKCGGDILAPPALCGNCARAIPPREPTPTMFIAGYRAGCTVNQQPSFEAIEAIWRAMYDAALAEKEGK